MALPIDTPEGHVKHADYDPEARGGKNNGPAGVSSTDPPGGHIKHIQELQQS